jgi:hypothetical protein
MSDTPRTDAAWNRSHTDDIEAGWSFAHQLERELNEAKATINQWKGFARNTAKLMHAENSEQIETADVAIATIARQWRWKNDEITGLRKQIDEANADRLRGGFGGNEMSDTPRTNEWLAEEKRNPRISGLGPWLGYCQQLERELNEALERIEHHKGEIEIHIKSCDKATAQRDQAEELAWNLWDALTLLVSDLPINKDWLDPRVEKAAKIAMGKARQILIKNNS